MIEMNSLNSLIIGRGARKQSSSSSNLIILWVSRVHRIRRQPPKKKCEESAQVREKWEEKKKPIRWRYKRNKTEELRNSRFQKKSEDRIVKKDVFSQKRSSIFFVVFHVVCSLFFLQWAAVFWRTIERNSSGKYLLHLVPSVEPWKEDI